MISELKTLNDMGEMNGEHLREPYLVIPKEKIKQEAINDIKELLKITKENSVHSLSIKFGDFLINPTENFREVFRIIEYLKWKNNLTEEDLK